MSARCVCGCKDCLPEKNRGRVKCSTCNHDAKAIRANPLMGVEPKFPKPEPDYKE